MKQADDFETTGAWTVTYKVKSNGERSTGDRVQQQQQQQQWRQADDEDTKTETFDAVMVCSGREHEKFIPTLENESAFRGTIMHTHEYRYNRRYS